MKGVIEMPTNLMNRKKSRDLAPRDSWFADPFRYTHDFDSIFDDFRKQFDDLVWRPPRFGIMPREFTRSNRMPAIDFIDKGDAFQLVAELPGVSKEDLDISISDNHIDIKAQHKDEKKEEKDNYLYQERSYMNFHRSLEFPEEILADTAEAKLEDGVLTISLPKKQLPESSEVKKLEIK